jgi:hypothetical protein
MRASRSDSERSVTIRVIRAPMNLKASLAVDIDRPNKIITVCLNTSL